MPTIENMQAWGRDAFESWLKLRFEAIYGPDADVRMKAADFSDLGLGTDASVLDSLEKLFRRLSPAAAKEFQHAVGALLRHARPGTFPPKAMRTLIFLVGVTEAYQELATFEPVIGSGEWGERVPELAYCALSVLKGLKTSTEAYRMAKYLVTSPHFPRQYVFDAYEVLVGSNPAHWARDLLQLADVFEAVQRDVEASGDADESTALDERYAELVEELFDSVAGERLAEGLAELTVDSHGLQSDRPIGRVLEQFMQGGEGGRIELDSASDVLRIKSKHSPLNVVLDNLPSVGELVLTSFAPAGDDARRAGTKAPAPRQPKLTKAGAAVWSTSLERLQPILAPALRPQALAP